MSADSIIQSRHNPGYKLLRSLHDRDTREQERAFLVEGPRFIRDAIAAGFQPRLVVVTDRSRGAESNDLPSDVPLRTMTAALFDTIADTVTSQGMIAVFPIPEPRPPSGVTPLALVVDGVQDPGNLGTLIRSAAGAGATQVVVLTGSADPWAPKTVRAAAGAHFSIPVRRAEPEGLANHLPAGVSLIGADARSARLPDDIDLTGPVALIIGSEGRGLSPSVRSLIDRTVAVPLEGGIESLNAGVAGSILLFEAARQRRNVENRRNCLGN